MPNGLDPRGELTICMVAMPADTNANGDIFGGWLVSHMDLGAGMAALRRANCRVVTVGIDQMKFIKPVYVGDTVRCYAELIRVGTTSMQFHMRALSLTFPEPDYKMVAEGIFTFVAIDKDGKPQPVDR